MSEAKWTYKVLNYKCECEPVELIGCEDKEQAFDKAMHSEEAGIAFGLMPWIDVVVNCTETGRFQSWKRRMIKLEEDR